MFILIVEGIHSLSEFQRICVKSARDRYIAFPKTNKIGVNDAFIDNLRDFDKSIAIKKLNISFTEADKRPVLKNSSSLVEFHATNCYLENVDDIGYLAFSNLRIMNLSSNALTDLKYHLFDYDNSLEVIDISYNCLETFYLGHELEAHQNISKIILKGNLLKQFKYVPRDQMFHLELLDLSWNQLTEFSSFTLVAHNLLLNNNNLSRVRYDLKKRSLVTGPLYLDAQFNQITRFESPFNFSILNLSHNSFTNFDNIMISQAQLLDLSWNQIESKADSTYYYDEGFVFNEVETLNLEGNKINDSHYVKYYFPETKAINLKNNPLDSLNVETKTEKVIEIVTKGSLNSQKVTEKPTEDPLVLKQPHHIEESGMSALTVSLLIIALTLGGSAFIIYAYHRKLFGLLRRDIAFQEFDDRNEEVEGGNVEVMFDRRMT